MNHKYININQIMTATLKQSLAAARSVFFNENMVNLLIETQVKEFSNIRKKYPELPRNKALKAALLNSAYLLKEKKYSEKFSLGKVRKLKRSPQLDWLKLHRSFILKLYSNGASYREIERAILYRFHHKISHTQISKFLKIEGGENHDS